MIDPNMKFSNLAPLVSWSKQLVELLAICILLSISSLASAQNVTYYHVNIQGTPVAATDENGIVKWEQFSSEFGYKPWNSSVETAEPSGHLSFGLAGHVEDTFAGRTLVYMQQRYFDPELGRFLSIDPIEFTESNSQSFNRYAYGNNNPHKYIDPDGQAIFLAAVPPLISGAKALGVLAVKEVASAVASEFTYGLSDYIGIGSLAKKFLRDQGKRSVPKGPEFYRGAKPGDSPDLTPRPNEFKVDKVTGTVKPTHGVSVFDNSKSVSDKGFVPHKIDQNSVPDTLQIIQRGRDPRHFEITPKPGSNLTPQQFIDACSGISCSN